VNPNLPLSLTELAILGAVNKTKQVCLRETVLAEATAILDNREMDQRVLNESLNRLVDLKLLERDGVLIHMTRITQEVMRANALRVSRVYNAIAFV